MVNKPKKEKGMTLTKYGFGRPSGGRFYLPLGDGYCNFYDRETGFNAILRKDDGTIVRTKYRDVTREEDMIQDFRNLVKEELGFDILNEEDSDIEEPAQEEPEPEEPIDIDNAEEVILSEEFWEGKLTENEELEIEEPEPEPVELEEEFEPAIPYEEIDDMMDPMLVEAENEDEEREIFLAAPTDEDGDYDLINMPDDDEDKFPRLDLDIEELLEELEENLDSNEEEEEFKAPSAVEDVNNRLTAASEARKFQPLNSYPEFPFGDGEIIKNSKNWDYDASEDVEVDLLNIVRSKDGKHLVKKTETTVYGVEEPKDLFKKRPKLPIPKNIPAPVIVVAAAVVALFLFSKVEKTKIY